MSNLAIRVQDLGKQYRIGQGAPRYRVLREEMMQLIKQPLRRRPAAAQYIWALKDVAFDIAHGEVVGIIGRNGAGKSTLLKILSRITEPTQGVIDLYGRVGSLLEVGTGFHQELTGRENIYLNGAILGMRRVEIERKFDEIVAFAEMEKFIDTPVKFYSSGMYMRLAFSVAVHLEPEILLVDEVLAVGDANFQKKCLGKMGDVAGQGRTVLFVSHQMNAIRELCPRCLWLDRGGLVEDGETRAVVARYLGSGASNSEWVAEEHSALKNPYFNPTRFSIVGAGCQTIQGAVQADERVGILIEGDVESNNIALTVGFAIYSSSGDLLFWSLHTDVRQEDWPPVKVGRNRLVAWLPLHFLNEGDYRIELILSLHFQEWLSQPGVKAPALALSVRGGLSQSPYWMMARPGLLAPIIPFQVIED